MNDRRLIYAAAFLRALATGMAGVLLGLTLARLGFSAAAIGAVLSAGLAGAPWVSAPWAMAKAANGLPRAYCPLIRRHPSRAGSPASMILPAAAWVS
ncbi:MAG: hypothetical protein BroJett006_00970 [Betaproteobacteria bacterium]|nr:MAG: hypothetical protein BroJett006_00970 [Betaproteobacteria bacterium]